MNLSGDVGSWGNSDYLLIQPEMTELENKTTAQAGWKYCILCALTVFLACVWVHVWELDRFPTVAERGHVPVHLEEVCHFLKHFFCKEEHRSTTSHSWKTGESSFWICFWLNCERIPTGNNSCQKVHSWRHTLTIYPCVFFTHAWTHACTLARTHTLLPLSSFYL